MTPAFNNPRIFRERIVEPSAELVGYAALVHAYKLDAPIRTASCIAPSLVKAGRQDIRDWTVFDRRMRPEPTLAGHLTFALRHEPIDLLLLKRLFAEIPADAIEQMVATSPTGAWPRRAWFLFEWLTGQRLDLPDASAGNYADALDPAAYITAAPRNSPRHRIRDNLLGTPDFCPTIRRTPWLEGYTSRDYAAKATAVIGRVDRRVLSRAASFLLLADSQASFQIEGERPPRNRIERWGRAVMQAGQRPLSVAELERLQSVLIEDGRHVTPGIRTEGVFLGDRLSDGTPLPEFIGARPGDLARLMDGMIAANARMFASGIDPAIQAAAIAFGFVMAHPFEDGNGRLHRFLVHHVLAERGFSPPGLLFPVSAAILDGIDEYVRLLRAHSGPLMDHIAWRPTARGNVEITNDTRDLYALFDATAFTEFLCACIARTVEEDLPGEVAHLVAYDRAKSMILELFDLPDAKLSLLILFVEQNGGTLPKGRRTKEFSQLTDSEVAEIEAIVQDAFRPAPAP